MKKQISKPENWQDFESLCKKLWGEVWKIPNKIKKNGRLGQPQCGVDIYGIPKDKLCYWGIQCKGKDEYVHAKLKKSEIDKEINNALTFKPELEVFIIATTANKDVETEEYVRLKDLENKKNRKFEILLFCWEDIVDLIEENRDTFNYYVNENQFRNKYDLEVYLNNFSKEIEIRPKFFRKIRKYILAKPDLNEKQRGSIFYDQTIYNNNLTNSTKLDFAKFDFFRPNYNHARQEFEIIIENSGTCVIEDWRIAFEFRNKFRKIDDSKYNNIGLGYGIIDFEFEKLKRTYIEGDKIFFNPTENKPLIQKDNTYFEIKIIPFPEEYKIPIRWKLLARDFDKEGVVTISVKPHFEDEYEVIEVDRKEDLMPDTIISIRETEREQREINDDGTFY